ncbi:unnamed protein product, partial [Closterium sp. NIES-65]
MSKPRCLRAKARLAKCEAKLKAYADGRRCKMQEQAGIKVEMNGEAPTGFLSSRVKARKAKTRLANILYQGSRYEGAKEALKAASDFYTNLFAAGGNSQLDWEVDKCLSQEDAAALSAPWDEAEVKRALAEMASGKTPGRDGLPKELWESQWDLLGGQLMRFLKDFERTGVLSREFSTAVTVLLHKKGAKDDLQNYRPITLLSTVYKLIAKLLANRIKSKLESVVSTGQFGFLPGRSIAGAVAVAADVIDAANAGKEDLLMLLVDFRKAFDSVARGYLFDVLRKMGFPEAYVKWVEGLHHGAATRICNDGWLGEEVPVLTGERQGCPLAPYLFLCAVEPFCQEARRRWLGIKIKDAGRLTYLGYADDTTLLLDGRSQLGDAELLLKEFERMSGLAVNWDKSVVLPLGSQRDEPPPADGTFKWASRDDPERLLGAGSHREEMQSRLNAYVMPVALFQAQIYPPPNTIWEELRRLCHAFVSGGRASSEPGFILWNGDLMQLKREEGGLGVINLKDRLDAEALHSLAQLLTEEMPQRRLLAERAANLPLGYASILAHEALLKAWGTGSERWKAITAAAMASPAIKNLAVGNRWDIEMERVLFNRHILREGSYPFGRRKGDECLHIIMVGDLLMKWADGTRSWKSPELLARDLGSKQAAEIATAIREALSDEWKERILKPLTTEELAEATTEVRTTVRGMKMWQIRSARGSLLYCVKMSLRGDGKTWVVPEGAKVKALSMSEVTPMAMMGDEVIGELGVARSRLLKSELCEGKTAASLKQLRVGLGVGRKQSDKLPRRAEWEQLWGKKIDWGRAIARRDSHVVPARARDVLLRAHCFNLQVGDSLKFLGIKRRKAWIKKRHVAKKHLANDEVAALENASTRVASKLTLFAHFLATDAMPWALLSYIRLTEEDTSSSSRIFIKIMFQSGATVGSLLTEWCHSGLFAHRAVPQWALCSQSGATVGSLLTERCHSGLFAHRAVPQWALCSQSGATVGSLLTERCHSGLFAHRAVPQWALCSQSGATVGSLLTEWCHSGLFAHRVVPQWALCSQSGATVGSLLTERCPSGLVAHFLATDSMPLAMRSCIRLHGEDTPSTASHPTSKL